MENTVKEEGLSDDPSIPPWRVLTLSIRFTTSSSQPFTVGLTWDRSLYLGLFLSLMDTSIVATGLYTIGTNLSAPETVNWVALAYMLVNYPVARILVITSAPADLLAGCLAQQKIDVQDRKGKVSTY